MRITKHVSRDDLLDVSAGFAPDRIGFLDERLQTDSVFLAQKDGVNLGFLIYSVWWGDCPFIEYIKVKSAFQRDGVGMALLNAAIEEIRSKGHEALISSTKTDNDMGLSFHEKAGFAPLNALVMPDGEEQFYTLKI